MSSLMMMMMFVVCMMMAILIWMMFYDYDVVDDVDVYIDVVEKLQ